jgi:hypothetical protein
MNAVDPRLAGTAKKPAASPGARAVKASAVKGLLLAQSQGLAQALAAANRVHPLFKTKK